MAQCPCPISLPHPHGTTNAQRLNVPCGKCPICLANRRADWSFRLNEEQRNALHAHFVTLTYSDEALPYNKRLNKKHLQLFNKRLRKSNNGGIRYYAVGEYGSDTNRPHYHGIYFGILPKTVDKLEKIWGKGHIQIVPANSKTIHYTTKYVIQDFDYEGAKKFAPFAIMSTKPALGHQYINRNEERHIKNQNSYVVLNGFKQRMPQYYKSRIFTASERQKQAEHQKMLNDNLWLQNPAYQYRKTEIDWIENQFRIINKQSKSK